MRFGVKEKSTKEQEHDQDPTGYHWRDGNPALCQPCGAKIEEAEHCDNPKKRADRQRYEKCACIEHACVPADPHAGCNYEGGSDEGSR